MVTLGFGIIDILMKTLKNEDQPLCMFGPTPPNSRYSHHNSLSTFSNVGPNIISTSFFFNSK